MEIAKLMNYDAMGVGNHDFDDGRDGLLPFAKNVGFPLLAANLNVSGKKLPQVVFLSLLYNNL